MPIRRANPDIGRPPSLWRTAFLWLFSLAGSLTALAALAQNPSEPIDTSKLDPDFADQQQFYSPYRRDGIEVAKQTSRRTFSGGPAVFLLNDRVAKVRPDGTAALYVHELTRVLDRDGIARYGEVSVPKEASLLDLRTIKSDGTLVEPELNVHKSTISMPGLAPGDAVDVEYVIPDLDGGVTGHPDAFQFTFGSFAAPTILSRFIFISPENAKLRFVPFGDIPVVTVSTSDGMVTRSWQANDAPQSVSEVSMPLTGVLPSIHIFAANDDGWAGVRDFYRDEFIDATRISGGVAGIAREIPGQDDEQRLRAAFHFVTSRIRNSGVTYESGDIPSAEDTLATYTGSRTAALLALARELGIPGNVVMARDVSPQSPVVPSPYGYTHPLIVFRMNSAGTLREVLLDAESDGIGFGGVAAGLERKDALLVPIDLPAKGPVIAALPPTLVDNHSIADGEVSFSSNGDMTAHIMIRMGAARGAQMRTMLSTIEPADRKRFFEQLATRIFPGDTHASGDVQNESSTDAPLILTLDCHATRFADFSKAMTELNQLVPSLGLKSMYATPSFRKTPLLIDTPLFETTAFRIHLPDSMTFVATPRDLVQQNEFGSYSVSFKSIDASTIEVRRDFNIPVQIVETRQFDSFLRFARDIEEAERQHLTVERSSTSEGPHLQPGRN